MTSNIRLAYWLKQRATLALQIRDSTLQTERMKLTQEIREIDGLIAHYQSLSETGVSKHLD